jgi:uncharacterized membrane protein YebE (DUF533 family)
MLNAKTLLDALVSASARPGGLAGAIGDVINQATSGLQDATQKAGQAPSLGQKVDQTIGQVASGVASGQRPGDLMSKAKQVMADNPGLAEAAAIGLAGLLFGSRKKRGMQPSLAQLGGLALVGGLAYKAYENYRAGKPLVDLGGAQPVGAGGTSAGQGGAIPGGTSAGQGGAIPGGMSGGQGGAISGRTAGGGTGSQPGAGGGAMPGGGQGRAAGGSATPGQGAPAASSQAGQGGASSSFQVDVPQSSHFHPVSQTEDDALLYLRAMVAAASADGQIDEAERARITKGLSAAGLDEESTRWLEREMAAPADVEELSAGITTPEKAAQVYTAARLVIDPDTIQEREFLRRLAESLDLDEALRTQIDGTASALKGA